MAVVLHHQHSHCLQALNHVYIYIIYLCRYVCVCNAFSLVSISSCRKTKRAYPPRTLYNTLTPFYTILFYLLPLSPHGPPPCPVTRAFPRGPCSSRGCRGLLTSNPTPFYKIHHTPFWPCHTYIDTRFSLYRCYILDGW